jgi:hypothetical protein
MAGHTRPFKTKVQQHPLRIDLLGPFLYQSDGSSKGVFIPLYLNEA